MIVSDNCIKLIMEFEGFSSTAYPDPGSSNGEPWTIGFGTTLINGVKVKRGDTITKTKAKELLKDHVDKVYAPIVSKYTNNVSLNQNEFDALVCFVYNIGEANFKKSSVLKLLLKGNRTASANAFGMWVKNDGKVMAGLVRRRASEKALFLKPMSDTAESPNPSVAPVESAQKPQSTDKSLLLSKEVGAGAAIGVSSVGSLVNQFTVDNAIIVKDNIKVFKTEIKTEAPSFVPTKYIIEGASLIVLLLSIFIIYKRIKDRNEGKK